MLHGVSSNGREGNLPLEPAEQLQTAEAPSRTLLKDLEFNKSPPSAMREKKAHPLELAQPLHDGHQECHLCERRQECQGCVERYAEIYGLRGLSIRLPEYQANCCREKQR